jgi:hypothetical protein
MATKKPSSKKSAKKSSNTTKRAAKKIKNKATEVTEATENKELQLETLTVSEDTQQDTTETINNTETMPTEANTTAPTQDTSDTSSLAPSAAAVNTEQPTPEKQTYDNLVVPQEKDNTYAFIIGGIVVIVTLVLFFL